MMFSLTEALLEELLEFCSQAPKVIIIMISKYRIDIVLSICAVKDTPLEE